MKIDIVILFCVSVLLTIPLLFLIKGYSCPPIGGSQIEKDLYWERWEKIKMARIDAMIPHAVLLWSDLLQSIKDKESKDEIQNKADKVYEYCKLMSNV